MNSNNSIIEPAHHEHRGRTIGIVLIVLALVVIGAVIYQFVVLRRASVSRDQALRRNYASETAAQTASFMMTVENKTKPATDADKKSVQSMITAGTDSPGTSDTAALFEMQQRQSDQDFQEWKAANQ